MSSEPPVKLPWPIRFTALICLLLSAWVGTVSTGEAMGLIELTRPASGPLVQLGASPELARDLQQAEFSALRAMRAPRTYTLIALAMACGFSMMSAFRLLRPGRLPLESARRLTAQSAAAAAILRTIDGAEQAVVAKRVAPQLANLIVQKLSPTDPQAAQALRTAAPNFSVASMVCLTVLVAGTFCAIWQYLRSRRVQDALMRPSG